MRALLALLILFASVIGSPAAEIRKGATMQVRANSIWFQEEAQLARWQQLKKAGDAKALEKYQEELLSERDAWQFLNQLTVKIISYDRAKNLVNVQMREKGRHFGTPWMVDPGAIKR
jgi:hypothetical protein